MADKLAFEVPDAVRKMAEQTLAQSQAAATQLMDMVNKAQAMAMQSFGSQMPGMQAMMPMQTRIMQFTQANMTAGFEMAGELARARDPQDYFAIQTRHAQKQMAAYQQQAQELGQLMQMAAQTAGAGMQNMPGMPKM